MITLGKLLLMGWGFAWTLRWLALPFLAQGEPIRLTILAGVFVAWLGSMIVGARCLVLSR